MSTSGQNQPVRTLNAFLRKQTIPHAILFTGTRGVGKTVAARQFALSCNCLDPDRTGATAASDPGSGNPAPDAVSLQTVPCQRCKSCKQIISDHHPDVITIAPEGGMTKIDQIRRLCHTLSMKPYAARRRIVIITDAQTMNAPAANALLKMLEEPPDRTTLILIAERTGDLLPTIVSRCQNLRFKPIPTQALAECIADGRKVSANRSQVLAFMAGGSYDAARHMAEGNWYRHRTWLLEQMADIANLPVDAILALAEKLVKNKTVLLESLLIMQSWYRDIAVCRVAPEKIIHKDLTDTIRYVSQKTNGAAVIEKWRAVCDIQARIDTNANMRLAVESLLFTLAAG